MRIQYLCGHRVQQPALTEASGIAASHINPNVIWAHNDSGGKARLYAMNTHGEHLGTWQMPGVDVHDCEDICIRRGSLLLGDIGGFGAYRNTVKIYRIREPQVDATKLVLVDEPVRDFTTFFSYTFVYSNGDKVDAETLAWDSVTDTILVVAKSVKRPGRGVGVVYRADMRRVVLERMVQLPPIDWTWTGGDISKDGRLIALRSYSRAYIWDRERFLSGPTRVDLISEPQGEAITFSADGTRFYILSERAHQPLHEYLIEVD